MRIVLLRHGIAIDRDHPECPRDPERFLTDRGISRTRAAARGLRRLDVRPEKILTSSWLRAQETAELCVETWGEDDLEIEAFEPLVPGHAVDEIVARLRARQEGELMLVGHAPVLDDLLATLVGAAGAQLCALKKAGAASILWSRGSGQGHLEWLSTPKALRRIGRR